MNRDDPVQIVARNMRRRREELGLQVADVAERAGVETSGYEAVEAGRVDVRIGRLTAIAVALRTSPEALLDGVPAAPPRR
jgi:transcriptional regulator with XRE-family HTH domain